MRGTRWEDSFSLTDSEPIPNSTLEMSTPKSVTALGINTGAPSQSGLVGNDGPLLGLNNKTSSNRPRGPTLENRVCHERAHRT